MKKHFYLLKSISLTFIFLLNLESLQAQKFTYKVIGDLGKNSTDKNVYLYTYNNLSQTSYLDSAILQQGRFVFTGQLNEPTKVTLSTGNVYDPQSPNKKNLYLENGRIAITADHSIQYAKISGGSFNKDYQHFENLLKPSQLKIDSLYKTYTTATEKQRKATSFMLDILTKEKKIKDEEQLPLMLEFIKTHPASVISLHLIIDQVMGYANPDPEKTLALLANLSENVMKTPSGLKYTHILNQIKGRSINQKAALFTQKDPDNKDISLIDFRGKYVLLEFWASWCTPCRAQNPALVKLYNEFKDKNFTILGISLDNSRESWIKAIKDDGLEWPQVSDLKFWNNQIAELYYIKMIPQNILVDKEGIIIDVNISAEKIKKILSGVADE